MQDQAEASLLIDRFTSSSPMRLLDTFDLSFASGASLGGVVLTYVIVLLQFKTSG